jgi:tetratricopeptide (TPR) repeat protein
MCLSYTSPKVAGYFVSYLFNAHCSLNLIMDGFNPLTTSYTLYSCSILSSCNMFCTNIFPISKATGLDGTFPPAWIGTGIAYAAQEEGDQAMAAFRTAARLFPGCHLPTLYMGMQYLRMHNFKLAEQFFTQAKSICPSDPLIYNEMGVVAYNMKEYQKAVQWFELTLEHTSSSLNEMWEPTLVNLGHALRKLK